MNPLQLRKGTRNNRNLQDNRPGDQSQVPPHNQEIIGNVDEESQFNSDESRSNLPQQSGVMPSEASNSAHVGAFQNSATGQDTGAYDAILQTLNRLTASFDRLSEGFAAQRSDVRQDVQADGETGSQRSNVGTRSVPSVGDQTLIYQTADGSSPSSSSSDDESSSSSRPRSRTSSFIRKVRGDAPRQPTLVLNQINPREFNGDRTKARAWLRHYEETMNVNGYTDEDKMRRASAYLRDEATDWLTTILVIDPELDWYCFKSRFLEFFCGLDSRALLRRELDKARQKPEDPPSTYLTKIVNICQEYDPRMKEEAIIDKIAQGLHYTYHNQLALYKPKEEWTIKWMLKIFGRFKRPDKASRETQGDKKRATSAPAKPRDLSTWTCFNCAKTGHTTEDCSKPRDEKHIEKMKLAHRQAKEASKEKSDKRGDLKTDAPAKERNVSALQNFAPNSFVTQSPAHTLASDGIEKPTLAVIINDNEIVGRIDTGADISALPSNVADDLKLNVQPWNLPELKAAGFNIKVKGMASVIASYNGIMRPLIVAVMPRGTLKQPLWGMDLIQALALKLEFNGDSAPSDKRHSVVDDVAPMNLDSIFNEDCHPVDQVKFGELDRDDRTIIESTLTQYKDVFSRDENDIGRTNTIKHRIHLIDDKPIHKPPYRIPVRNRELMDDTIKRLIDTGAIRESTSPYASPVFFVDKDQGASKRLVADYRSLNAKTIPDRTPMPHPEDVFGLLAGSKIFTKLDITAMFNQIPVDERDVEKTAITTPFGLFECPLMPFGLINAPATAVRLMKEVLRGLDNKTCFVYFDDIIVFAPDTNQLVQRCTEILDRLREHGLKLKPSKCQFAVDSVRFLGHIISARGVEMDPRRVEQVINFPTPKDPSDVRSFYGLCSYNRKFIRGFSHIARPLTPLMGKPTDFVWNDEAQKAFDELKLALTKTPTLVHFDPKANHELRTDASSFAMGAVLYQRHELPELTGTVLYWSRSMNGPQQNYSATERELLAAHEAIMELKHYLYGKKFTLVTDHNALSLIHNQKDPHRRLARWVSNLQGYEFDVVYKSGIKHKDADCMSRLINSNVATDDQNDELDRNLCHVTQDDGDDAIENDTDELVDIREDQRNDDLCKGIIEILESPESTRNVKAKHYVLLDNILYRRLSNNRQTLVVPARRRAAVLLSCHDAPLGGAHLGFMRTYRSIQNRFYWPKMRKEIKKYVASCLACQRRKALNQRREGLTQPLPIAEEIFDTVGIDLMTDLPKTDSGYNTLLVCTDNLSKYVVTVPLKDMLAETIIHAFFNNVVAKHGCPRVVISDRGQNIAGERSRDFFRLMGIKKHQTTAYHPQSNGQTERFNRTFAASMTSYVARQPNDWSDYTQAITFSYNTTEHSVTRVSPFEFVFGRLPRLPIDNVLDRSEFIDPTRPAPGTLSSDTTKLMKEYILKNQAANKRRLDARLAATSFKEGDMVLVERIERARGACEKFSYKYIGPYKITKKLNDLNFEILFNINRPGNNVVHVRHLKKYHPRVGNVADDCVDPTFVPREQVNVDDNDDDDMLEQDHDGDINVDILGDVDNQNNVDNNSYDDNEQQVATNGERSPEPPEELIYIDDAELAIDHDVVANDVEPESPPFELLSPLPKRPPKRSGRIARKSRPT